MQMKKTTHILLWIAQILLSLCLSWAGIVKLFQPVEQLKIDVAMDRRSFPGVCQINRYY